MLNTNFSPWPCFSEEEVEIVSNVLRSNRVNYWTGDQCRKFEQEFANFAHSKYAISLTNGTNALELALIGLGIGKGDEVVVSPRSFVATVSSVVMLGATPVFADVDADSQNITLETVRKVVTSRTKAVIPVHLAGCPADMQSFMDYFFPKGIHLVEDCAQAHGAKINGKSVGSFGDVGAWSFCQDKIMTTGGEGGMVTTSSLDIYNLMWSYKDHGKSASSMSTKGENSGYKYVHDSFGTNWRMTEMQAALGRYQLQKMPEWNISRIENAKKIWETASSLTWLRVPKFESSITHAAYKAYVFLRREKIPRNWSRERILEELWKLGIPCYSGSCPEIYKEKAYTNKYGAIDKQFPVAAELGALSLMFLVHPTLTAAEIEQTCDGLLYIDRLMRT